MSDLSRRKFLKTGAVAGAAAVATSPVAAAAAVNRSADDAEAVATLGSGTVMLYVKNAKTAEVAVLAGEAEYVVRDAELVRRMAKAARKAR